MRRLHLQVIARMAPWALLAALTLAAIPSVASAACADAVCPIRVKAKIGGKYFTSSGFFWKGKQATYAVTALHGVVGASAIYVTVEGKDPEIRATIARGHKASDLALLLPAKGERPFEHPGVVLAEHVTAEDLAKNRFWVVGFPARVKAARRAATEFHASQQPISLQDCFDQDLVSVLCKEGYPAPGTRVFTVGSVFDPGHSGSAVVDQQNRVVAIADGSLARNEGHRTNWAIPAAEYLTRLEDDPETLDGAAVALLKPQADLKYYVSASTSADTETAVSNQRAELVLASTLPLDVLLAGYDDESRSEITALISTAGADPHLVSYDVYESYATRELLVVPAQATVTAQKNSFLVRGADSRTRAVVSIRSQEGAVDGLLREIRGKRVWYRATLDDDLRIRIPSVDETIHELDIVDVSAPKPDGSVRVLWHLRDMDDLNGESDVKSLVLIADLASVTDRIPSDFIQLLLGMLLSRADPPAPDGSRPAPVEPADAEP